MAIIVREDAEIVRVDNWAVEAMDTKSNYPGMSYEQGVADAIAWLLGGTDTAPRH